MSQHGAFTPVFCPATRAFDRQWLRDTFRVLAEGFPGSALQFDVLEASGAFVAGRFLTAAHIARVLVQSGCQPEDAATMAADLHAEMQWIEQRTPVVQAVPGALPVPGVPGGAGFSGACMQGSGGVVTRSSMAAPRLDPPVWQPERSLRANLDEWDRFQSVVGMHGREYAYLLSKKIPDTFKTVIEAMPVSEQCDPVLVRAALIANTPDDSLFRQKGARRKLDAAQHKTGQSLVGFADELFKLASEIRDNGGEDLLAMQGVKLTRRFVEGLSLELKRGGMATQLWNSGNYVSWTECRLAAHHQDEMEVDPISVDQSYGGHYGGVGRKGRGTSPKGDPRRRRGKESGPSNPRDGERASGHSNQRRRRSRSLSSSSSGSDSDCEPDEQREDRAVVFHGTCYYCKKSGHRKAECPARLSSLKSGHTDGAPRGWGTKGSTRRSGSKSRERSPSTTRSKDSQRTPSFGGGYAAVHNLGVGPVEGM